MVKLSERRLPATSHIDEIVRSASLRVKVGSMDDAARQASRLGEAPKVAPEGMVDHGHDFVSEIEAALRSAGGQLLQDRDADSFRSLPDRLAYFCENLIAMNSFAAFYILATAFVVLVFAHAGGWYLLLRYERDAPLRDGGYAGGERRLSNRGALNRGDMAAVRDTLGYKSFSDSVWMALQVLASAGSDPSLPTLALLRCVYLSMIICGLVVFAVLVGFITESVESFMRSLAAGRTKVVERGHTLILGTSEATPRVVTQLALMRKRYQKVNETWERRLFPWRRAPPSTPLLSKPVVIMTRTMDKEALESVIGEAFTSRSISRTRTRIGRDIVCRVGDPASAKDLARVSADTAAHVLIMMSEQDEIEEAETRGKISNGASLRTLLALRHVLFTSANHSPTRSVVAQILKPSIQIEAASFRDARGYPLVKPLDMGVFLNSLLFSCASQQGLSLVLMELLDCEGAAFQRRRATLFCGGVVGLTVAAADDLLDRGSIIAVSSSLPGAKPELCPPPDTVIKAEDVVIFVAETSTPKATPRDAAFVSTRAEAARRLKATQDETRSRLRRTSSAVLRGARYILVCGWRPVWTDEAHRLRDRVYQLLDGATPGSQIIFANGLPELTFRELMTGACGFRDVSGADDAVFETALGVRIRHVHGDAADVALLRRIVMNIPIETAIVLGTNARALGDPLAPKMRDTRVLNILLTLRHLRAASPFAAEHMHVIGENAIDETRMLALTPESGREPDFINTQAIFARALALSLAYPIMGAVVRDVFDISSPTSIKLVAANRFAPLDTATTWGAVKQVVRDAAPEPGHLVPLGLVSARSLGPELGLSEADGVTLRAGDLIAVAYKAPSASPPSPRSDSSDDDGDVVSLVYDSYKGAADREMTRLERDHEFG